MSNSPNTIFSSLLKEIIAPALKDYGYCRRGNSFYLFRDSNCGLINFQKSVASRKDRLILTINLGVASSRLLESLSAKHRGLNLSIADCHWTNRIGNLQLSRHDKWWTISRETHQGDLGAEIVKCLMEFAVPEIEKHLSDEALRDLWISGTAPGLTDFQRLVYLSLLLKTIGPNDLLQKTVQEMRLISDGDPSYLAAEYYLDKLDKISS
jgi:hypothetical protein